MCEMVIYEFVPKVVSRSFGTRREMLKRPANMGYPRVVDDFIREAANCSDITSGEVFKKIYIFISLQPDLNTF
jgi:hypothetical protein